MPIYSYRCETCGFQQDVLRKMSDPLLVDCPSCGASTFAKQVTAAGFQLKGSGWYVTDFRNPSGKAATKDGDKGGEKGNEKGGESEGAAAGSKDGAAPSGASESGTTAAKPSPAPSTESSTAAPAKAAPSPTTGSS